MDTQSSTVCTRDLTSLTEARANANLVIYFVLCAFRGKEIKGRWIVYNESKYFKMKTQERSVTFWEFLALWLYCSSNFVRDSWHCSTLRQQSLLAAAPSIWLYHFGGFPLPTRAKSLWSKTFPTPPIQYSGAHIDDQVATQHMHTLLWSGLCGSICNEAAWDCSASHHYTTLPQQVRRDVDADVLSGTPTWGAETSGT